MQSKIHSGARNNWCQSWHGSGRPKIPSGRRRTAYQLQDIEVGDPDFDEAFIVKGNDEDRARVLFSDPKIRQMIQDQPEIRLEVKDSEGWFGPSFPEDVDELHFQVVEVIKNLDRLKALFELFAAVLDRLCRMGSAYKQEAGVEL